MNRLFGAGSRSEDLRGGDGARDDTSESVRLMCEGSNNDGRVTGEDAVCDCIEY